MSMTPWIASSPPVPRIAAPRIFRVSASTTIFINPCVSPFSIARPTRLIGRCAPSSGRPPARAWGIGQADPAERRIDIKHIAEDAVADLAPFAVEQIGRDDLEIIVGRMGAGAAAVAP